VNNSNFLIQGPYLQLATICERHILEADGALTLFRIIDRFTVQGTTPEMPLTTIQFMVVISFRSGDFRGTLDLKLKIVDPSVNPLQEISIPMLLEGPEERATQMFGNVTLALKEQGLYWIIVELDKEEKTRIPVRIVYQRQPTIVTGN
jgi:hypothetical protein